MPRNTLLSLLAWSFLAVACGSGEAPSPLPPKSNPQEEPETPTPKPEEDQPTRPLTGYEGYMLLFEAGLSSIIVNIPDGVSELPSLRLMDRDGKLLDRDIYQELIKEVPALAVCCEMDLSASSKYFALMTKYDFTEGKYGPHTSRLTILRRSDLSLVKSIPIILPSKEFNEWVTGSCTTNAGDTYFAINSRRYRYLNRVDSEEMIPLQGLSSNYLRSAFSYEDKAYFVLRDDPNIYLFSNGSEKAQSIPIASKGGIRADNAAGDYRVLTDNDGRNFLFSLKESKVVATFWTSPSIGRGSYYDRKEGYLYFTTDTGSDAKMRSLYRIPLKLDNSSEQSPKAELYFRIGSRTEYDSRQGYFLTVGADPYTRKLYLSWLDQGRTGPAVENRTKMYQLPMLGKEEALPVKSLALYHLHRTYNISSIYHYRQLP